MKLLDPIKRNSCEDESRTLIMFTLDSPCYQIALGPHFHVHPKFSNPSMSLLPLHTIKFNFYSEHCSITIITMCSGES